MQKWNCPVSLTFWNKNEIFDFKQSVQIRMFINNKWQRNCCHFICQYKYNMTAAGSCVYVPTYLINFISAFCWNQLQKTETTKYDEVNAKKKNYVNIIFQLNYKVIYRQRNLMSIICSLCQYLFNNFMSLQWVLHKCTKGIYLAVVAQNQKQSYVAP